MFEGHQLETMSDQSLCQIHTPFHPGEAESIFARMAPRHKIRVVSVMKDMGEVVAVTGDGVNNAPGPKKAAIGIAMGIAGTDLGNVFACRSDRLSLSQLGWLSNPLLLWGVATELIVLAFIIYTPWGNAISGTNPLPVWIFGPLALGALALFIAEESRKFIVNQFTHGRAGNVAQQAGAL